jgi:predicted TIM-barrel fold metal-dependent hydrolase
VSDYRIISADDHMDLSVLPPDLFVEGVPSRLRERVPRVVDEPDGRFWTVDGARIGPSGRKAKGLLTLGEDPGFRPANPRQRLEDMDRDTVYAQVVYGPPRGFDFVDDVDVRSACILAYNDWADEFNAVDRDRLVVLAMLPSHTAAAATTELRRIGELGHRGALLGCFEPEVPVFVDEWDEFWAVADEIGIPIHFHLGSGLHSLSAPIGTWQQPAAITVAPMQMDEMLAGMLFSGIFRRHPNVRLVLGESGLGWVPYVIERADHEYRKYHHLVEDRLDEPPSEYFRRHLFLTFEEDALGLDLLVRSGFDNAMWASDYPHGDSTWPNSRRVIEESQLGKLPDALRRRIICDNAAELYRIA